jgi:hypothetical protein
MSALTDPPDSLASRIRSAAVGLEKVVADLAALAGPLDHVGAQATLRALAHEVSEEAQRFHVLADTEATPDAEEGLDVDKVSASRTFAVFDMRQVQDRGASAIKWYNPNTHLGDTTGRTRRTLKRGICFHHTAVTKGFGTHRDRVAAWKKVGARAAISMEQPNKMKAPAEWKVIPASAEERKAWEERWPQAMALADRYRGFPPGRAFNDGVPYHLVFAQNGTLYLNLPFDWVTWHGDNSNTHYLGFAWDARSSRDKLDRAAMLEAIACGMEQARQEGHFAEGCEWTMHCAYTNKPSDAGRDFAQMLVEQAPKFRATLRLDFKASKECMSLREVLAG